MNGIILYHITPDGKCLVETATISPTDFNEIYEEYVAKGKEIRPSEVKQPSKDICFRCDNAIEGAPCRINGHPFCEICYLIRDSETDPDFQDRLSLIELVSESLASLAGHQV